MTAKCVWCGAVVTGDAPVWRAHLSLCAMQRQLEVGRRRLNIMRVVALVLLVPILLYLAVCGWRAHPRQWVTVFSQTIAAFSVVLGSTADIWLYPLIRRRALKRHFERGGRHGTAR